MGWVANGGDVFMQLSRSPQFIKWLLSQCSCTRTLQGHPGIPTEQTIFLFHVHHPGQESTWPVSPSVFHATSLSSPTQCNVVESLHSLSSWKSQTQVKISAFLFSPEPEHNFWFLRPKEEKIQNDLKTSLDSKSSPASLLCYTLPRATTKIWQRNGGGRVPDLRAHDAGRGRTHQSVHSLHRTPALQAARSSCSC